MNAFLKGLKFIHSGWQASSQIPGVKKWIIIPFAINFLVFILGFAVGSSELSSFAKWATLLLVESSGISFFQYLYYPFLLIFLIVFIVLYTYVTFLIASVIASPFYAVIAEKVLVHRGLLRDEGGSIFAQFKRNLQMIAVSLLRLFLLLFVGLFLFIFSFLPGVNLLTSYFAFIIMALDTADYSMETMGLSLSERIGYFKNNFSEFAGMGLIVGLTALIPGLILLVMPYAVIGSAINFKYEKMRSA